MGPCFRKNGLVGLKDWRRPKNPTNVCLYISTKIAINTEDETPSNHGSLEDTAITIAINQIEVATILRLNPRKNPITAFETARASTQLFLRSKNLGSFQNTSTKGKNATYEIGIKAIFAPNANSEAITAKKAKNL